MRISDWSSDVCSSDLRDPPARYAEGAAEVDLRRRHGACSLLRAPHQLRRRHLPFERRSRHRPVPGQEPGDEGPSGRAWLPRSEEHTSELQSLMRLSYAVFCLKKNNYRITIANKIN